MEELRMMQKNEKTLDGKKKPSDFSSLGIIHSGTELKRNDEKDIKLNCFGIQDIIDDLFAGKKTKDNKRVPALISHKMWRDHKEIVEFLIPDDIMDEIKEAIRAEKTTKNENDTEELIKEKGKNNDYQGFLLPSVETLKITKALHEVAKRVGLSYIIKKIRNHIINGFKGERLNDNARLKEYLIVVSNTIIVPESVSKEANDEMLRLTNDGGNSALSIVTANILISAMFGLRPLKVNGSDRKIKAYTLNNLGMKYIWCTDMMTESVEEIEKINRLYMGGEYKAAYDSACDWLIKFNSESVKKIMQVRVIIGLCMLNHPDDCMIEGKTTDEIKKEAVQILGQVIADGIAEKEKTSLADTYYELYKFYIKEGGDKKAYEYLSEACEGGNRSAVIETAKLAQNMTITTDINKLITSLDHVIAGLGRYENDTLGECLYLRGMLKKRIGDKDAEQDFEKAAQKGNRDAKHEIKRQARYTYDEKPEFIDEGASCVCYANSMDGFNEVTINTFPSRKWTICLPEYHEFDTEIFRIKGINEFIDEIFSKAGYDISRAVMLFMSDDENKNLRECLMTLDKLFNVAINTDEKKRNAVIDMLDIYVMSDYESAAMLIDSSVDDMGNDIFFKVHIVDRAREAARSLICDAPLFIPFIRDSEETNSRVVLLGSTEVNYQIIKESIACCYMGEEYPVEITMIGDDAEHYKSKFRRECLGMLKNTITRRIETRFIKCNLSEANLPIAICHPDLCDNDTDREIAEIFRLANYMVVDMGNDSESIRLGMDLRTWLLRSGKKYDRAPFIAINCADGRNSYLAEHLTLAGQSSGDMYYSKYDLFMFGVSDRIFSYRRMIDDNRINRVALNIHKSYYGNNERAAIRDFYAFSYNSDSSSCMAIGLGYRLFACGCYYNDVNEYIGCGALYKSYIHDDFNGRLDKNLERAAQIEQSRWNGYMLSRGWESASNEQVLTYIDQATGSSHKHQLAKLHPFIREWDEINDEEIKKLCSILKKRFKYDKSPQNVTRQGVRDTVKFIDGTV